MTASSGPDRLLAGRYLVGQPVGRGRSPVYRARDTQLGREVAVKQVGVAAGPAGTPHGGADAARVRALREARAAACLTSSSVVQVYDVVEDASTVWLVMELVHAPTLEQLVHDRGPLAEPLAARIGLGVLDALEDAHAHGIVHGDVRPANVLVGELDDRGPDLAVKLADFGVAVLRDEPSVTAPGTVTGSPTYAAPEQATGAPPRPAADLWALGALLYFAVEGRAPFAGDSSPDPATAAVPVHGEPRPQQRPGRLSPAIELLLDERPDHRMGAAQARAILQPIAGDGLVADGVGTTVDDTAPAAAGGGAGRTPTGPLVAGDHARGGAPVLAAVRPARRRPRTRPGRVAAIAAAAVLAVLGVTAFRAADGGGGGPAGREAHSGRDRAADAQAVTAGDGAGDEAAEDGGRAAPPTTAAAAAEPAQAEPVAAEPPATTTTLPPDDVTTTTAAPSTTEPIAPTTTAAPDPSTTTTTAPPGGGATSPEAAGP